MSIAFVGQSERLFDRIELNKARQDRCVRLNSRPHCLHLRNDLAHVFSDLEDAHVEACMLLFMLVQERFKVLMHRVQESVDFFKTRLG